MARSSPNGGAADERNAGCAALVPALGDLVSAADEIAADPFDEVRRVGGLVDDPLSRAAPTGDAPDRAERRPSCEGG